MKKKVIITILLVLMYMILVSCNSCTSSSAQPSQKDSTFFYVDTIKKFNGDSLYEPYRELLATNYQDTNSQDTMKKIIIKKRIQPMMVDTTWSKRDSIFKSLEKTEKVIKEQQKTLDSLIVIKKK